MKLLVRRDIFTPTTTLGVLRVLYDGRLAYTSRGWVPHIVPAVPLDFGFTCEDEDRGLDNAMSEAEARGIKVAKETAIGVGEFEIFRRLSPKRRRIVPELRGVVAFRAVQIHRGNREKDTDACILPGLVRDVAALTVGKSTEAEKWLDDRIAECLARRERVRILIERDEAAWAAYRAAA